MTVKSTKRCYSKQNVQWGKENEGIYGYHKWSIHFLNSVLNKLSLFVSTEAVPNFFNFIDGQYEFREKFLQHPSDTESCPKFFAGFNSTDVKASLPQYFRTSHTVHKSGIRTRLFTDHHRESTVDNDLMLPWQIHLPGTLCVIKTALYSVFLNWIICQLRKQIFWISVSVDTNIPFVGQLVKAII